MKPLHPFWRRVLAIEPNQAEIARKSGLSRGTISNSINSSKIPRIDTAACIAKGLGVSQDYLVSGKISPGDKILQQKTTPGQEQHLVPSSTKPRIPLLEDLHPFWRRVLIAIDSDQTELAKKTGAKWKSVHSALLRNKLPSLDIAHTIAQSIGVTLDNLMAPEDHVFDAQTKRTYGSDAIREVYKAIAAITETLESVTNKLLEENTNIIRNTAVSDRFTETQEKEMLSYSHYKRNAAGNVPPIPPYSNEEYLVSVCYAGKVNIDAAIPPAKETPPNLSIHHINKNGSRLTQESWETPKEHAAIPLSILPSGKQHEYTVLEIHGTSMENENIPDGARCLVHRQQTAENGQIVLVLVHGTYTLRTLIRNKDGSTEFQYYDKNKQKLQSKKIDNKHYKIMGILVRII